MPPIPITIVTGFLGSGKTTLILNLIPQLPKDYRIALLKNEFGLVATDSLLASSAAISGVEELLNGCICCNLVGQLSDALTTLRKDVRPNRILIETSGSAFPATLAMEINRLARETEEYILDGVVVVIDVENWKGYEDTSYTAKLQARYTDLIVMNKWERVNERRYDDCMDRIGDLEIPVAVVKSDKGKVSKEVLFGLDATTAEDPDLSLLEKNTHEHDHDADHHSEVEVLDVTLSSGKATPHGVNLESLETFLLAAPKDEVYRIKGVVSTSRPPASSDGEVKPAMISQGQESAKYILNWAFGRWHYEPLAEIFPASAQTAAQNHEGNQESLRSSELAPMLRLTVVTGRGEAESWKTRIEAQGYIEPEDSVDSECLLRIKRII